MGTTAFLFSNCDMELETLQHLVDDNLTVLCGISDVLAGVHDLARGFAQAQRRALRPSAILAAPESNVAFPFNPGDLKNLVTYIETENYPEIDRFFDNTIKHLEDVPIEVCRQCYYALSFAISCTLGEPSVPIPAFTETLNPTEQFSSLHSLANTTAEHMRKTLFYSVASNNARFFRYIEFAVYCREYETGNYDAFRETIG